MNTPPFQRTTCACSECVACCKRQPGPLALGDAERIDAYLKENHMLAKSMSVMDFLWASPGAKAMTYDRRVFSIPTITPRMVDGRCVFLDSKDRCMIHPVSPFGCAYFDTHQGFRTANERSLWMHTRIHNNAEYLALRARLPLKPV